VASELKAEHGYIKCIRKIENQLKFTDFNLFASDRETTCLICVTKAPLLKRRIRMGAKMAASLKLFKNHF